MHDIVLPEQITTIPCISYWKDYIVDIHYPLLNHFVRERLDPLIAEAARLVGATLTDGVYLAVESSIFFAGMFCLSLVLRCTAIGSFLLAVAATALSLVVVGADAFYFNIHWFPLLIASYLWFSKSRSVLAFSTAFITVILWAVTAGALSFFGALVCIGAVPFLSAMLNQSRTDYRKIGPYLILITSSLFLSILLMPVFDMPDYPDNARVTPIATLTFESAPLFGPTLQPLPIINQVYRTALELRGLRLLLVLATVVAVVAIGRGRSIRDGGSSGLIVLLFWSLFVFAELVDVGALKPYLPYQIVRHLVPGVALERLPWLLMPFGFAIGLPLLFKRSGRGEQLLLAISAILLLIIAPRFAPIKDVRSDHFARLRTPFVEWQDVVLSSPSAYVAETYGLWVAAEGVWRKRSFESMKRISLSESEGVSVSASSNSDTAARVIAHRNGKRWTTGRPQQPGDWFMLELARMAPIARVVLSVAKTPTDFPRGLKVSVSRDGKTFHDIFHQPVWHGSVRWTARGYPYFGPQSEVVIDFPAQESVRVLRFEQLGTDARFDWAIDEIKLYQQ